MPLEQSNPATCDGEYMVYTVLANIHLDLGLVAHSSPRRKDVGLVKINRDSDSDSDEQVGRLNPSLVNSSSETGKINFVTYIAGLYTEDDKASLSNKQKGGFRASMFIFGSTFLLSLVGGFISDTYLNRLHTVLLFGILEILGLALLTIQARYESLHPEYCGGKSSCVEGGIAVMLYASLTLLALGSGGVRGALVALGADQFDKKDPEEAKGLATFFNWLRRSTVMGGAVGVTGIVWVSTKKKWYWGFFISTVVAFAGYAVIAAGKPFFSLQAPGESPILRIAKAITISRAIKNRKLPVPDKPEALYENNDKESTEEKIGHTNQFRQSGDCSSRVRGSNLHSDTSRRSEDFDKNAAHIRQHHYNEYMFSTTSDILSPTREHYGSSSILGPAASIPVIPLVFMCILLPAYEFLFVPFARKISHHSSGITQLQRVGVGLVLSAISMAVAGIVEGKRRDQAKKEIGNPISVFWLSFQDGIFGIADVFTLVGLLEFFYKEAPACMRSPSTSFTFLSLSFGYMLSSVFVDVINAITKRVAPSKKGWIEGTKLNENNLNMFYRFLAILSCLNFINYLFCSSWYKYKAEEDHPDRD
ncbi:protein NRT1/ PTR FAMILY 4.5-like [Tripterygium wilfordii]|uniref:Protein NRT1/ PTR FAMILY 4.5-like n=1 Tax=Tripterygium wilfordii TaxID=458696 RepID=A0A7J7D0U5_TRIWF|nr:protein NRT1/ PTR FAMILY 4.5-like [Tripterygium wilfordii]